MTAEKISTNKAYDSTSSFQILMRQWRVNKKLSQLALASLADVSQRHISFLESGKAKPSKKMVLDISEAFQLPLRERNQLLQSAGFAAVFKEHKLNDANMTMVKLALDLLLEHHEPYPAVVVDRNWDLLHTNSAASRLMKSLGVSNEVWDQVDSSGRKNIYRLTFHPSGMRSFISNWTQLENALLMRLKRESNADPTNGYLRKLIKDMTLLSNGPSTDCFSPENESLSPVLPMEIKLGEQSLKMISMISAFGTAQDVIAEELRVELFFPADKESETFFQNQLSAQDD